MEYEVRVCIREGCGNEFVPRRKDKKYCSSDCSKLVWAYRSVAANPAKAADNKRRYQQRHPDRCSEARRKWKDANLETHITVQRRSHLKKAFNMTPEQYDRMLAEQGGVCAICNQTQQEYWRYFCVDHDHACCPGKKSCGKCIRGLLCQNCNKNLAYVENADWLRNAVKYLETRRNGST